ncbi:hypothetical protein LINGRAHAP2_LOCUS32032 [Linum grandiflorum]
MVQDSSTRQPRFVPSCVLHCKRPWFCDWSERRWIYSICIIASVLCVNRWDVSEWSILNRKFSSQSLKMRLITFML